ncbi:hypothetical protein HELRODRAFT_78824, partial [Helobdella robusta]|uniref:LRRNT domain-containing protein n=1 Tax=Helobdella robusta TaxID=6412 RepID=T1G3G1_HELRO
AVTCPEKCDCYLTTVNCKGRNLTSIPKDIPISTKILYLGFNLLTSIEDKSFEKLTNLTELYLNNNHICKVANGAFYGLSSLKILSFTTNKLTSLSAKVLEDVSLLKELFLTNNDLVEIPNFASVTMKGLVQLNLNNNKL